MRYLGVDWKGVSWGFGCDVLNAGVDWGSWVGEMGGGGGW